MSLPKWAKARLAVNRVLNRSWGTLVTSVDRDTRDAIEAGLFQAWRMGYRAGIRQAKLGKTDSAYPRKQQSRKSDE